MNESRAYPAWVDGRILPAESPGIAPGDEGFLLGLGIFETLAVESGIPLFLEEHLARMAEGATVMGLRPPPVEPEAAVQAYVRETGIERAAMRITWTRGAPRGAPSLVVTARDLPTPPAEVSLAIAVTVANTVGAEESAIRSPRPTLVLNLVPTPVMVVEALAVVVPSRVVSASV